MVGERRRAGAPSKAQGGIVSLRLSIRSDIEKPRSSRVTIAPSGEADYAIDGGNKANIWAAQCKQKTVPAEALYPSGFAAAGRRCCAKSRSRHPRTCRHFRRARFDSRTASFCGSGVWIFA